MQLTIQMFADYLGKYLIEAKIPEDCDYTYESVQVVFPGQTSFQPGHAYVVNEDLLYKMANINPACLVIFTQGQSMDLPCPVLVCQGSMNEVYGVAIDAISHYSRLEREFNDGLLADKDISYFVRICVKFFKNRVQIHDAAHNYIAGEEPFFEENNDEPSDFITCNEPLPISFIADLKKTNELRKLYEMRTAQFYNSELFPSRSITLNFFDGDGFLGRLIIIENITEFSCAALDTVNFVGKYFKHLMTKRASALNAGLYTDEYYLAELLNGNLSDYTFLVSYFTSANWNVYDQYKILYVQLNSQDMINHVKEYYVNALSSIISSAKVFPYQDSIVAVIPLKNANHNEIENDVSCFLKESDLYAGLSELFNDLTKARDFFEQAKAAVRLGLETKHEQRLFNYRDFALEDFILGAISQHYRRTFMHPAVQVLMDYDKRNNTSYLDTLSVYLDNDRNQATTAKKLHIHLNSLKYRLTRLIKIMNINLDDPTDRLRLMLSLKLKEVIKDN